MFAGGQMAECVARNDGGPFTKQLTGRESLSTSKRWGRRRIPESSLKQMEGLNFGSKNGLAMSKRVMVVVDQSSASKQAVMWALTHVASKGDLLTLLEVISPHKALKKPVLAESSPHLASSLESLCKACRSECITFPCVFGTFKVDVEALVLEGPKLTTVLGQVKKLEAAVLVLGQKKPSALSCLIPSDSDEFVESCISKAACMTMAVRKQSGGLGGYLVSNRWQKNFWLLA